MTNKLPNDWLRRFWKKYRWAVDVKAQNEIERHLFWVMAQREKDIINEILEKIKNLRYLG